MMNYVTKIGHETTPFLIVGEAYHYVPLPLFYTKLSLNGPQWTHHAWQQHAPAPH